MKKRVPNKMVTETKAETKTVLTCARECVIPGMGTFRAGDRVTSPVAISQLLNHPYFETTEEEQ